MEEEEKQAEKEADNVAVAEEDNAISRCGDDEPG